MIAEHREAPERRVEPRQDCGDRARRQPSAAEQLHVDEIAAMQHEVRLERRSLADDGAKARNIARVGAGVEVRQERDAQRARENRGQPAIARSSLRT